MHCFIRLPGRQLCQCAVNAKLHQSSLFCPDVFLASMYTRKSQRSLASAKVRNFPSEDWNVGWSGPHISDDELVKLGSEAELLRVRACTALVPGI